MKGARPHLCSAVSYPEAVALHVGSAAVVVVVVETVGVGAVRAHAARMVLAIFTRAVV